MGIVQSELLCNFSKCSLVFPVIALLHFLADIYKFNSKQKRASKTI